MAPSPPPVEAVFRQTLILSALAVRADIDPAVNHPQADKIHQFLVAGLKHPLLLTADPAELKLLSAPLGSLDPRARAQAWRGAEGVTILAWALQMSDFPRHDQKADAFEVTQLIGLLEQDPRAVLQEAALRSPIALSACRNLYDAIHRRLQKPDATRLAATLKPEWLDLLEMEADAVISRGDLSYQKRPVSEAAPEALAAYAVLVEDRLRAAAWLLGGEPVYSKVAVGG
jgi:hypothetical protein